MPAIIQTKDNFTKEFIFENKEDATKKYYEEESKDYWSRVEARKVSAKDYRVVCWSWYI